MKDRLLEYKERAEREIDGATSLEELKEIRIRYLGRRGPFGLAPKLIAELPPSERPGVGKLFNDIKAEITKRLADKFRELEAQKEEAVEREKVDITLPGRRTSIGKRHPITLVLEEIKAIFERLGFDVVQGPEVESDYYNFEALNIPKDHPARDLQDTFYLEGDFLLRTHTSPVQIRVMEKRQPPLSIICPGAVYRRDFDLSHSPMFHQVEGLVVDRDVSFADLKTILTIFAQQMFGPETAVRFRPGYFPFTEPSAEVDIRCVMCGGKGCPVCGKKGWLEILGSGMVHPDVFRKVGYDPEGWTGYAFGMGVERIAMLKFEINDIRLLFDNDLRFLKQFQGLY